MGDFGRGCQRGHWRHLETFWEKSTTFLSNLLLDGGQICFQFCSWRLLLQVFLRCELSSLKILPAVQYHIYFSFTLIYFPFPPCCTKIYFEPLKSLCATLLTRSTLSLCFQTTTTTNSTKSPQLELVIWDQCTRIICSSYFECLRKLYKWLWCMFRTRQQ